MVGNWNDQVTIIDTVTKERKQLWKKLPYPPNEDQQYGFTYFSIQLNYFPKRLQNVVAPTDTRRRPDQRALENGDMKLATFEKDRLENRQRTFRKYHEAINKQH